MPHIAVLCAPSKQRPPSLAFAGQHTGPSARMTLAEPLAKPFLPTCGRRSDLPRRCDNSGITTISRRSPKYSLCTDSLMHLSRKYVRTNCTRQNCLHDDTQSIFTAARGHNTNHKFPADKRQLTIFQCTNEIQSSTHNPYSYWLILR